MTSNTKHPAVERLQPPDRNIKIWRYMKLPQLIDFLETRSLYFARADTFDDPYEGTWTESDVVARERAFKEMPAEYKSKVDPARYWRLIESMTRLQIETTYINGWHGGETENIAMWDLYGKMPGSVVIQSTYKKLMEALPDKSYLGMVKYQDYSSTEKGIASGNSFSPFMHKRKQLEHEKEVRACIWILGGPIKEGPINTDELPKGLKEYIDIDKVVETIRVRPETPTWIKGVIENLLKKYACGINVMSSQIDIPPRY